MARRSEEFARVGSHGGYTQALTVGKGFSGTERKDAKGQDRSKRRSRGSGGDGGGGGTTNAFARHQGLIRNYHRYNPSARVPSSGAIEAKGFPGQMRLTDEEALKRQHRFVRDRAEDDRAHEARGLEGAAGDPSAWEVRMASKYYKLLFKEYALADLSRYREDKVGLRWRTEKDVVSGKGQFECGSLSCQEGRDLHSYELNFRYKEAGSVKNELVKVRVCPRCARKLFRKKIEALRQLREAEQKEFEREQRRRAKSGEITSESRERGPEAQSGDNPILDPDGSEKTPPAGHDLVRQAMEAATGGGDKGGGSSVSNKRSRSSRWGAAVAPPEEGVNGTQAGGAGAPKSETGADQDSSTGDNALRKAWAGELERDRTAEDEMDDYLSSLLL